MATCNALDNIISSVRSSNLNYSYQETPFSLYITIRKTKVKRVHASGDHQSGQQDFKHNVELENLSLKSCIRDLEEKIDAYENNLKKLEGKVTSSEAEALHVYEEIKKEKDKVDKKDDELESLKNANENYNFIIAKLEAEKIELNNTIEKKEKEVYDVEKTNEGCQNAMKKLKEEVTKFKEEKNELERQNEQLEKNTKENKKAGDECKEQLDVKDKMLNELTRNNEDLEEKINSLLDLLYGCNYCGRHGDYCECDDIEGNDVELPAPDQCELRQPSSPSIVTPCIPPLGSTSPPWTPPPTPPCSGCGGVIYGPCPTSLCFACIPSLTLPDAPPCSDSPSTTPPGTPPSLSRTHQHHQSVHSSSSRKQI